MGPVLAPPIDRYARRREAGKQFADAVTGFFQKQAENEATKVENEALKKQGIDVEGLRGKTREHAIKSGYERLLKGGEEKAENNLINEFTSNKNKPEKPEFNYKKPESWTDKQVDRLRALEAKTPKAKTLANMAKNEYERRAEAKKSKAKYLENITPFEGALDTISEMEKLGSSGLLGIGTKARGIISTQARKNAAEYERLGKSLIQYSTNIPIRNRQEFETLAHDLYDPSISDDARAGILTAMKKIIRNSMKTYTPPGEEGLEARRSEQKERRPLTVFVR